AGVRCAMRVYKTPEIRNVAVVGHGASGKTSLVDALAFVAGTSKRPGSVKDGTALTDYTADEIERKYSINLALAVAEWLDTKLNLIDTPGYLDFTGEALAGVHAADGAVVVLSATGGVEVGTEKVWDYCETRGIPRLFFVSLMDKEHADFERVYAQVKERLTPKVIPVEIPVGEGPAFHGIINLFSKKCHMYKKGTKAGEYEEGDVPPEYQARFERYSKELIERIAETDDTLLERYLGGQEIGRDEAIAAMKAGMAKGELFPLFCGAAELTYGMRALLTKMVELLPTPHERPPIEAQQWGSAERVTLRAEDGGPFVAQVFKTISEPHVGDVTFFRVYSGTVRNGQDVYNAPREAVEKLNHLCVTVGKDRFEIPELHAGDIGAVAKLRDTHTNDTLSTKDHAIVLPKIPFPEPVITEAIDVKQRGEEEKLSNGLHKLHEEDPTFQHEYSGELGQTLIRGLGERHLETIVGRLARKFAVHALNGRPKIAYRDFDWNEMLVKMAGILAFRNVSPSCKPVLVEPILELEVWTPDEYQGAVMGDLSSRRGQILGTEPDGRQVKIKALVPEAELDRYATTLHSITHGRGTYRAKFHVYQEVPPDAAQKVAEVRKKELEEAKA